MPVMQPVDTSMGEKAKRLPPRPRIVLNGCVVLPAVDDDWQPINDKWVLPGRVVLTTQEIRDLARTRGMAFDLIN